MQFSQQASPQSRFNANHDGMCKFIEEQASLNPPVRILHEPQARALQRLRLHFAKLTKPNIALVVMPTGTGKSGVVALIPYALNSSKVLIITPSVLISTQIYADMCGEKTFYEKRGICQKDRVPWLVQNGLLVNAPLGDDSGRVNDRFAREHLVIANAHKFGTSAGFDIGAFSDQLFDTVIVDEAHHYPAETWRRIIDHFKDVKKVFLTATPSHRGINIVGNSQLDQDTNYVAYQLSRPEAEDMRIIRPLDFVEMGSTEDPEDVRIASVAAVMMTTLLDHDSQDPPVFHQGMILC